MISRPVLLLSLILGVTACEPASESSPTPDAPPLAEFFDCLRENGGLVVAAHRGGPAPGYPENAIETLQFNLDRGLTVFEVDVVESADGVPYLFHDRTFGRTATGEGSVAEMTWEEASARNLIDNDGDVTDFHPPLLADALDWAVRTNTLLELDRKSSTSYERIVQAVREAKAEAHVVLITYSTEQAVEVAAMAPDLMFTAGLGSPDDLAALVAEGVNPAQVIAWSGTRTPNVELWAELSAAGVESAFGTLGRAGQRLDDQFAADGDLSEYAELAAGGLTLLASDTPYEAAESLTADERANTYCAR
jgi:glycerophosphoryl diester phosphodiesterase